MSDEQVSNREEKTARSACRDHLSSVLPKFVRYEAGPISQAFAGREAIRLMDVGANIGLWSKAMFEVFGDRLRHAYLVEPQSLNISELSNGEDPLVFTRTQWSRTTVLPVAAGSAVAEQTFYTNTQGSPLGSLYQQDDIRVGLLKESEVVQVVTVDLLMHLLRIPFLDILKIDAEGHDLAVLQGATRALTDNRIDAIQFEHGESAQISRVFFKDFWSILKPLGFSFYYLGRTDKDAIVPIEHYNPVWEKFTGNPTYLACRTDRTIKLLRTASVSA